MSQEKISIEALKKSINRDVVFADFPEFSEITDEVRAENMARVFTGGVRINMGMYRTDKETEEYIMSTLTKKLP